MKKRAKQMYFARILGENTEYQVFEKKNLIAWCELQNCWVCDHGVIRNIADYLNSNPNILHVNLLRTI